MLDLLLCNEGYRNCIHTYYAGVVSQIYVRKRGAKNSQGFKSQYQTLLPLTEKLHIGQRVESGMLTTTSTS